MVPSEHPQNSFATIRNIALPINTTSAIPYSVLPHKTVQRPHSMSVSFTLDTTLPPLLWIPEQSPSRSTPSVKLFLPWHIHDGFLNDLFTNLTDYFKVWALESFCNLLALPLPRWVTVASVHNLSLSSSVKWDRDSAHSIRLRWQFSQIVCVNCLSQHLVQSKHLWMLAAQHYYNL